MKLPSWLVSQTHSEPDEVPSIRRVPLGATVSVIFLFEFIGVALLIAALR